MLKAIQLYRTPLLFAVIVTAFYLAFAYDLERSDFIKFITLYAALSFLSYTIIRITRTNFGLLTGMGLLFRMVLLFALPNLSQDFYRFLWDGRLLMEGINPYLFTPDAMMANTTSVSGAAIPGSETLYAGMGSLSAGHFSNYPPLNQLFFTLAAFFGGKSMIGSVMVLRIIIILADIGILYFGKQILEHLKLPAYHIFWYFLNPFTILELTGNLHFEGVMLFFLILSLYLLLKHKWFWSAVFLALSIGIKLIPLIFLPLYYFYFRRNPQMKAKMIWPFYGLIFLLTCLFFLPFISEDAITHFASSIGLWFSRFEFNASVYYLVRWVGFEIVGWNIIAIAGKVLAVLVFLIIVSLGIFRKNNNFPALAVSMVLGISAYFLLATTVHPWYVATPLLLSVFTTYRFPLVWSVLVMLSYSAYGPEGFSENLWLVALEYVVVISIAIWELFFRKKEQLLFF